MVRLGGTCHLLVWFIHVIAVFSQQSAGNDFIYDPKGNDAPRAMLEFALPLGPREFTISLFAYIYDHKDLSVVNLFSYSSREAGEIAEVVLELNYTSRQTHFYIHGVKASIDAIPPVEEWTQVYMSWESKTGDLYYYIDGQLAGGIFSFLTRYRLGGDGYFVLGQRQGDYNADFKPEIGMYGMLSELNIWPFVLAESDREQVFNCKRFGSVINWNNTSYSLLRNIEQVKAEAKNCGSKPKIIRSPGTWTWAWSWSWIWKNEIRHPGNAGNRARVRISTGSLMRCNYDEVLEKVLPNFTIYTNEFQEKINLIQKQTTIGTGRDNEIGEEEFRKLSENFEKAKEEINRLQRKNDIYEQKFLADLNCMKQKFAENDKEIYYLKAKSAVYEDELNSLKTVKSPTSNSEHSE